MNAKQDESIQTAIRLPKSILTRADKLAESMSAAQLGKKYTRADTIRIALFEGLAALENEERKKKR